MNENMALAYQWKYAGIKHSDKLNITSLLYLVDKRSCCLDTKLMAPPRYRETIMWIRICREQSTLSSRIGTQQRSKYIHPRPTFY